MTALTDAEILALFVAPAPGEPMCDHMLRIGRSIETRAIAGCKKPSNSGKAKKPTIEGELNTNAYLTDAKVAEIKNKREQGASYGRLAQEYSTPKSTIQAICNGQRRASQPSSAAMSVDEHAAAKAIGMSVAWLRKDRRGKRLLPFFRLGGSVRYNLERVREALAQVEEGGQRKPKSRA